MRLGNAMFTGWISRFSLFGANLPATGDSALKLRPHVFATPFFKRICAAAEGEEAADRE